MAQGFITLDNGRLYHCRWTGYDEIIRIAIKELRQLKDGDKLAEWLITRIPNENEDEGDAVFWNEKGEMIVRSIDLRQFKKSQRQLFWMAIEKGAENLSKMGKEYSPLNPIITTELLKTRKEDMLSRY